MGLETNRLRLEEYKMKDLDDFFRLKSCDEVWRYERFCPIRKRAQAEELFRGILKSMCDGELTCHGVFLKESAEFIGEAGILEYDAKNNRGVVCCNLLPEYWGNGYGTEITAEILRYAFLLLHIERIEALVLEENVGAIRVLNKNGFVLEGTLRNYYKYDSGYQNVCYYSMLASDYRT